MALPTFRYHPEPLLTGSIIESDVACVCCGQARGHIYTEPVFATEDYAECICPWCIFDGSAHAKLDASFTDEHSIGGGGAWDKVSQAVVEEIAFRTPGFSGWQQEQWWTHCGDAAQFIGRAGGEELKAHGSQAVAEIQDATGLPDGPEWNDFLASLSRDGAPTAYLFRCTRCGVFGGYQDSD
jgi:uncharacterized protein CbrC (UPF0167 family)